MSVTTWLIIAAIFLVIEIISQGLTTIWFAVGSLFGALMSLIGVNIIVQIVVCAIVSLLSLFAFRPLLKKCMLKTIDTNIDSLIGEEVLVITRIDNFNNTGQIKLNGVEWTAKSVDNTIIEVNETVKVKEIKGVKAYVERV